MATLRAEGISVARNGEPLFHNFSFDTSSSSRIAIMGSTGAGKTTLLKMMAGLLQPDGGRIMLGNDRVLGPNEKLIAGHPLIGYLSQHYELRNNYYVKELLEMSNQLTEDRKEEVIQVCNIRHLLNRRTDALSGGERQRIALAKILLTDPKWLLLDEPYSNLDLHQKRTIMQLLKNVGEQLAVRMIMVSHDASDMLSWADDLMIIQDGNIIQRGNPLSLYHHPENEYVAGLLGEYNLCNAVLANKLIQQENFYPANQHFMIRPEHVFVSNEERGVKAEVKEVFFKGGYYLVKCKINEYDSFITVATSATSVLQQGSAISIYSLPAYCVAMPT